RRAGGLGQVEAQRSHAITIAGHTSGSGIGAGGTQGAGPGAPAQPPRAAVRTEGEVLVAVARTDAPLDEVMRTIEEALKKH
ncbi:TetR family transcriptional regulator, partial [Streptomyces sp. NPDC059981]